MAPLGVTVKAAPWKPKDAIPPQPSPPTSDSPMSGEDATTKDPTGQTTEETVEIIVPEIPQEVIIPATETQKPEEGKQDKTGEVDKPKDPPKPPIKRRTKEQEALAKKARFEETGSHKDGELLKKLKAAEAVISEQKKNLASLIKESEDKDLTIHVLQNKTPAHSPTGSEILSAKSREVGQTNKIWTQGVNVGKGEAKRNELTDPLANQILLFHGKGAIQTQSPNQHYTDIANRLRGRGVSTIEDIAHCDRDDLRDLIVDPVQRSTIFATIKEFHKEMIEGVREEADISWRKTPIPRIDIMAQAADLHICLLLHI